MKKIIFCTLFIVIGTFSINLSAQTVSTSGAWVVNSGDQIFAWVNTNWKQVPGRAKDIGVGANGDVWVIGANSVNGGFGIYKWNGRSWVNVPGGAVRIDVGPNGDPWVVNSYNHIYHRVGNGWKRMPGLAKDIGVGANGAVWIIGANPVAGGFGIYRWNGSGWVNQPGGAVRIDVGNAGVPWVVNTNHDIFYLVGGSVWKHIPGRARDIGVGASGAWVIGINPVAGGYGIYRWAPGATWKAVPGGARDISVGGRGTSIKPPVVTGQKITPTGPVIVKSDGTIFAWDTNRWKQMPGLAKDIGAGAKGSVWIIGTNGVPGGFGIYNWNGRTWIRKPGGAVRIDVGSIGYPWVVNSAGGIFHWLGNGWRQMPGRAKDIGVGANGAVWIIGTNAVPGGFGIYRWNGSGWVNQPGGAVRIDVGPNGQPWVVNAGGGIFRLQGSRWQQLPGRARDIGVGITNKWVIGTNAMPGGFGLYAWSGTNWRVSPGVGATEVTVVDPPRTWGLNFALGKPCAPHPQFVTSLFQSIVERQPDRNGLNYWVGQLNSGKQRGWVVSQFFLAQGQSKKKNNNDFVRDAYQSILQREPEPGGHSTWMNSLNKNMPRENMIKFFLNSKEFKQKTAKCSHLW